jgi:hypothetical protein
VAFGDGIAQLSLTDRRWISRAVLPVVTAVATDAEGHHWVGTRDGVFRLIIDGNDWRLVATGLEGSIGALAVDPAGYLIASVDGKGIFRARLLESPTNVR